MTTDPTPSIAAPSIAALDGPWPDPGPEATRLMREAYRARTTPLDALDAEQIRVLLTQRVGVDHVVPIALRRLAVDPLLEGDLYPGDVLTAVVHLDHERWQQHGAQRDELVRIAQQLDPSGEELDEQLAADVAAFLQRWA